MELPGDRNWWLPRGLDRRVSVVHVEPVEADAVEETARHAGHVDLLRDALFAC